MAPTSAGSYSHDASYFDLALALTLQLDQPDACWDESPAFQASSVGGTNEGFYIAMIASWLPPVRPQATCWPVILLSRGTLRISPSAPAQQALDRLHLDAQLHSNLFRRNRWVR